MNEEVDPMSIIDEVIGPDEEEQETAYQLNRKKLNQSRNINPNRWQEQKEIIKGLMPDPNDPAFMSELLLDMKAGYSGAKFGLQKGGPKGALIGGVGGVLSRRVLPLSLIHI